MNETEMGIAVEKMQTYVALAEDEIAYRKKQCELMHKDLLTSRRLMESLQQNYGRPRRNWCCIRS